MKKNIRERDIEAYLCKQVKYLGGEVRKVKWIARAHAPDRLMLFPLTNALSVWGLAGGIWVEVKAPGKKPTAGQTREHERLRDCGARVEIVDSIESVNKLLGTNFEPD